MAIQWTMKMFLFRFVLKSGLPNARLRSFVDWMSFLRFAGRSQISLTFFATFLKKRVQSQISLTFVCDFSSKIIMWDIIDILCDFSQQRVIICNLRSRWHSLRLFSTTNNVHPHAIPLTLFATFSTMNHVHMFASKQGMVWSRPRHMAAFPQFFSQLHVRSSANAEFSHFISFRSFRRVHFGVSVAVARISNGSDLGDTEESLAESMRIEIRFAELKFDSLNWNFNSLNWNFNSLNWFSNSSDPFKSFQFVQFNLNSQSIRIDSIQWIEIQIRFSELNCLNWVSIRPIRAVNPFTCLFSIQFAPFPVIRV